MASQKTACVVFWFRRDLRLSDNKGLFHALKSGFRVLPLFIFDDDILISLPPHDHRLGFIYDSLLGMHQELRKQGGGMLVRRGRPLNVFESLLGEYRVEAVYCNKDHEPYGQKRDEQLARMLEARGVGFHTHLDHLLFDKDQVLKDDQSPYRVFTPYSKKCRERLGGRAPESFSSENLLSHITGLQKAEFPSLTTLGLRPSGLKVPPLHIDRQKIAGYGQKRDFPAADATTRLGVHLRFGTLSIRRLVAGALELSESFLNELLWREFYAMILWHFPKVTDRAFKPAYDLILWRNRENEFERWKEGNTGFPMVDAGMRQLNATGYMHNRLRMITASFLSKHLLADWRLGEAYFAQKLFDYELSSNNGGWQLSAGTGCDAAPYFRIFNPMAQQKKFDPRQEFVREWIPGLDSGDYPPPMVDHALARERCLKVYRRALKEQTEDGTS